MLLSFSLLLGCAKEEKVEVKPKRVEKPIIQSVELGAGDTVVYQSAASALPSFSLRWKAGGFDAKKGGIDTGRLGLPSGELYTNGKPTSTYRADKGDANEPAKRLKVTGNVVFQSVDKANTLKAAQAEYRGDLKLVRLTGGVTARGPFGTLSGVPELWATPDLRLIGTPDMVSKTLKLPALLALATTAAVGSATFQRGSDYKLENLGSASTERPKSGPALTTLVPQKGRTLSLTILSRGITFRSAAPILIYSDSKGTQAQRILTQGAVEVVQEGKARRTEFAGTGADYRIVEGGSKAKGQDAMLQVGGRVTMTNVSITKDSAGKSLKRTTVSKGDRGEALMIASSPAGAAASEIPIKNATLTGNVKIDVSGDDGTFSASGDRLVYTVAPKGARAVLTGDLKLSGDLPQFIGDVKDADKLVILLDNSNEWTNIYLDNTRGTGTTTTIDPKAKPKTGGAP